MTTALAKLDELVALDPERFWYEAVAKLRVLLDDRKDASRGYAFARELVDRIGRSNSFTLTSVATTIVDAKGVAPDLKLAARAAERAVALNDRADSVALEALARVRHAAGDRRAAIKIQREAVGKSPAFLRESAETTLREREAPAARATP